MAGVPLPLTRGTTDTVAGQAGGALVRRTVLPGGVRVLTESVPGVRSVTLGCWVGVGSRAEAEGFQDALLARPALGLWKRPGTRRTHP